MGDRTGTRDGGLANNVFVFSRESGLRRLLENLLLRSHHSVLCFSAQADCLRELSASRCDLLIVGCDGGTTEELGVLAKARQKPLWIPVIVLVDAGDIATALRAMKLGAFDCMEKPVRGNRLLAAIELGLSSRQQHAADWKALTKTEAEVLQLTLTGKTIGEIAAVLYRSGRTVEVHRRNIMRKLHAHCAADLVRWAVTAGIIGSGRTGLYCG